MIYPPLRGQLGPFGRSMVGASAFNPISLGNLKVWLKASAGVFQDTALTTPATADGDPVGGWVDQSGSGNNVLQATVGAKPALKLGANGIGGVAALSFDGARNMASAAFGVALSQPNTIYIVFKRTASASTYCLAALPSVAQDFSFNSLSRYGMSAGSGLLETTGSDDLAAHVAALVYNGASSALNIDNASKISGNAGANSMNGVTIMSYRDGTLKTTGLFAELLIYNAAHNGTTQTTVYSYLKGKYGTP